MSSPLRRVREEGVPVQRLVPLGEQSPPLPVSKRAFGSAVVIHTRSETVALHTALCMQTPGVEWSGTPRATVSRDSGSDMVEVEWEWESGRERGSDSVEWSRSDSGMEWSGSGR